jgi:molybdenum cofactor synthesis domain-containing protein
MPIRCGVLTISDRSARGERADLSGPGLVARCQQNGWQISATQIVADEAAQIQAVLTMWCDSDLCDVILTTGGTGFAPRDITPEATSAILHRLAPGLAEAMRQDSLRKTPHAMLSRGVAGIRQRTLIINLPGSPKAALENLEVALPVIPHAVELLREDQNSEQGHQFPAQPTN